MEKENHKTVIVTAKQMQNIEEQIFAHAMPVASLMEKAALLSSQKIQHLYPVSKYPYVGIIIGCGHNGGDGLVIARELFLHGYNVYLYIPLANKSKPLTAQHLEYAKFLKITIVEDLEVFQNCHFVIDALFGFGLERAIAGKLADDLNMINQWSKPIVSIDIPSGIHTDTGNVLGTAIKATNTLCLGLWKLGLFQASALEYVGQLNLVDIGIPEAIIQQEIDLNSAVEVMTVSQAKKLLPLPRPINTHKYRQGNILLICGSHQYSGAALLAGYGAKSGGVGMLSMIVPDSVKPLINSHLPIAVVTSTPETGIGAMEFASLTHLDLSKYDVISFGMGVSRIATPSTHQFLEQLLTTAKVLLLDADGLNLLTENDLFALLSPRNGATILTPHDGEFRRLFPDLDLTSDRLEALKQASKRVNSIILLKGAKTMICDRGKHTWVIGEGTPALARGGSGDVLSGLITALVAQGNYELYSVAEMVALGAWLHQQGGILAAQEYTELGVDAVVLANYITKAIAKVVASK